MVLGRLECSLLKEVLYFLPSAIHSFSLVFFIPRMVSITRFMALIGRLLVLEPRLFWKATLRRYSYRQMATKRMTMSRTTMIKVTPMASDRLLMPVMTAWLTQVWHWRLKMTMSLKPQT